MGLIKFSVAVLPVFITFDAARAEAGGDYRVEAAVYEELQQSRTATAYVIVILQPAAVARGAELSQRMTAVAEREKLVLDKFVPNDFRLTYQYKTFAGFTGWVSTAGLAKLAADPNVLRVGLDAPVRGSLSTSVPFINADDVHNSGFTGQGITVAVLDTGVDTDHPDMSDNLALGAFTFLVAAGQGSGPGAEDDHGHGTNVAGIITSRGIVASVGVAPDADILAVKVLDNNNSGFVSDWVAGVDYVVSVKDNFTNLCAINISIGTFALFPGCPCDNQTSFNMAAQASLQVAKDSGIVTFCSSGNDGSCASMTSPACLSATTAVAAVFDIGGLADQITSFTNRSPCNELAAPGNLITAPGLGGGTSTFTGTSQASPHCAGTAALLCQKAAQVGVTLTPDEIVLLIKKTGVSTADPCATNPNPLRVDALAACNIDLTADCDNDGVLDFRQTADGTGDCNGNLIPDVCEIDVNSPALGGPFFCLVNCDPDCNDNGIPDGCEADCNGNGIPDDCDIDPTDPDGNGQISADCQPDGIADECQLLSSTPSYFWDDGTHESLTGVPNGGSVAWMNHFVVQAQAEKIGAISLTWGQVADGTSATVYLWSDPNGDGDPTDAQVLASAPTTTANGGTDIFSTVNIPDTVVGPAGTSFFAGAILMHQAGELPIPQDQDTASGQSWFAGDDVSAVDPNNLGAAGFLPPTNISVTVIVRAESATNDCNNNGSPDECDIADGTSLDCDGDTIPDECEFPGCAGMLLADMNCDGIRNGADIQQFVDRTVASTYTCQADMNQDGLLGLGDVAGFVAAILVGP